MRKLLSTLLALSLALSLGACAVKVEPDKPDEPAKDKLRIVFTEEHLTKEVEYKADDGTVLLADTGGKYVNYRIERRDKN